ncbi:hypothetical protein FKF97_10960 [Clostridium perfringens]|nr:hypothetical protein [Clostridium perfringens]
MNTTYDDIWEKFLSECGYIFNEIPKNEIIIKNMIKNASTKYNQLAIKYETFTGGLVCNDLKEELNLKLTDIELSILANIIAYNFAKFKFTEFTSLYNVVAKDLGIKDYKSQCSARKQTIKEFEKTFMSLIQDSDLEGLGE